jgi:penicillin-binding protein 1C
MKRFLKYTFVLGAIFLALLLYTGQTIEFDERFARIIYADGDIIGGLVSEDEQWRIHCNDSLPEKLATSIIAFEDQYFYMHPGINPISIITAMRDNFKAGRVVRGGSTLTMQLARIYQGNKSRTYTQKLKELYLSLAIELRYSKNEILALYAQYAPFGGNTIGYCAASYRYYGKSPRDLSWGEATTLAVLPNAPSDIYPGKGQSILIQKRNFLLHKLLGQNIIDSMTYKLSLLESLPSTARHFDSDAPHLLQSVRNYSSSNFFTTIDRSLQKNTNRIVYKYHKEYTALGIDNMAVLVINNDGRIVAYVGNSPCRTAECGGDVDIITSLRSPGSILKPFLYAAAMQTGRITRRSVLEDIPMFYNGYTPKNFDNSFRGIIDANTALTKSLNIPAVNLLSQYGIASFLDDLHEVGIQSIDKSAGHYGLSLILGSGEVTPLEIGQAYVNLVRSAKGLHSVRIGLDSNIPIEQIDKDYPIDQGTAWLILDMLKGVNRPSDQVGWNNFTGQQAISWKTGTSYGFRDAWSVGMTADYTVVVWVGNADGEGVPNLTGVQKAAPILFDIFRLLPSQNQIIQPHKALKAVSLCKESGYIATQACTHLSIDYVPKRTRNIPLCRYHTTIRMDQNGQYRVNQNSSEFTMSISKSIFVLDPVVNLYYKKHTGIDHALPPILQSSADNTPGGEIAILYPTMNATVMLTTDLGEKKHELISRAVSEFPNDTLHWFLDARHLGTTSLEHVIEIDAEPGAHHLTIVSSRGQRQSHDFTIL